jgi:hypothetical protein
MQKKSAQAGLGWQPSRPRRDQGRAHGGGDAAGARSFGDGGGGSKEAAEYLDAMFDRLREAAAAHGND